MTSIVDAARELEVEPEEGSHDSLGTGIEERIEPGNSYNRIELASEERFLYILKDCIASITGANGKHYAAVPDDFVFVHSDPSISGRGLLYVVNPNSYSEEDIIDGTIKKLEELGYTAKERMVEFEDTEVLPDRVKTPMLVVHDNSMPGHAAYDAGVMAWVGIRKHNGLFRISISRALHYDTPKEHS